MAKKLYYFEAPALAESIRYLLYYTKQEFEDVRFQFETWSGQTDFKQNLPYGQLPLYEEGDKRLYQSIAIIKYVARDTGLIPDDAWEQAQLDSIVQTIYDFWANIRMCILEQDKAKKETMRKKIFEELIVFFLPRFERDLKANGGYFVGKLSWAEFILAGIIESTNVFLKVENVQKDYPTIAARVEEIQTSPGVKEYIESRGPYNITFFD
uniref:glutathione transferase n=1 Tax=Micromelalopha troglodyta TaxID=660574 RepID=A0A509ZHR5_9NEOP|nr:glutathione S-transferase sigma1 [Micromelalopha troglodyta]